MSLSKLQDFFIPEDGKTVVELLGKYQDNALIVAGGTFLHGLIARNLVTETQALIYIGKLGLDYVKFSSDNLKIGSTTTFIQLQDTPEVHSIPLLGAIKDALEYPPTQVKNSATVGGCVAASCPFFDLPTSFLALNGVVTAQGPSGSRDILLQDFFSSLFENTLQTDEFMTEMTLPIPSAKSASAFLKLETNANDLAILNASVFISEDSGNCTDARVFVSGGVGEVPVRATSAEAILKGNKLDDELFAQAGKAAQSDVEPMTDHRASAEYRTAMTKVLVERALKKALTRLN